MYIDDVYTLLENITDDTIASLCVTKCRPFPSI